MYAAQKSFDDLLTVNGVHYLTFRQVAEKLGIIEEDQSIRHCLSEVRALIMPSSPRMLFATILIFCQPTRLQALWDENFQYIVENYSSTSHMNTNFLKNMLLNDINIILMRHQRNLKDFDLPQINDSSQSMGDVSGIIEKELSIPTPDEDLQALDNLNVGQMHAFNTIKEAIVRDRRDVFFVDGPGGTGKTYLYRALLAHFQKDGLIMSASATSDIAATQLPGGRTSHSLLKKPIKLDANAMCFFSKQLEMCQLLKHASSIIWDETPMANRKSIEIVDRTLRDVLEVDLPFGGKVMIFGGDFCQVVPVAFGGTTSQTIQASIIQSHLWPQVQLLQLTYNVKAISDQNFADFLLLVGNGEEPTLENNMIRLPNVMVIPWQKEQSLDELIS